MNARNKLLLGLLSAAVSLSLAACGPRESAPPAAEEEPMQSTAAPELLNFWCESANFAVRIPDIEGGWTQSDGGNPDHLVLDNSDQSFSILVQGLPKNSEQFSSLDSLMDFYRGQALSSFGDPTPEEVAVDPSLTAKAESYSVTQDGVTAKALVIFLEGGSGYYVYTITGLADVYDANIDAQRDAVVNFLECVG